MSSEIRGARFELNGHLKLHQNFKTIKQQILLAIKRH